MNKQEPHSNQVARTCDKERPRKLKTQIMNWTRIKPVEKINFKKGWEYGHPVYNGKKHIGYAAKLPSYEGEVIEFISLKGVAGFIS